jgi:hypothetical protein
LNATVTDPAVAEIAPKVDAQGALVGDTSREEIARKNWRRYEYVRSRGHVEYCRQARKCENFYLGGGLQWDPAVVEELGERMATEVNEIMGAVNAAIGYQVAQRMDVQLVAKGDGANDKTAKVLNLVVKQIFDNCRHKWHETQQWSDGLIQASGYIDVRMQFEDNALGDITMRGVDPMDGIPDPDAKSYDPDDWLDWTETRWLTGDQISQDYGEEAAKACLERINRPEQDWGDGTESDAPRSRFGDDLTQAAPFDSWVNDGSVIRYRVVDRQHHVYEMGRVAIYPTGDIRPIDNLGADEMQAIIAARLPISLRRIRRVRWTVSAACDVLLHDDWSPYQHFTVVPFFPYFRRGRRRGMVDNAISPQEVKNKAMQKAIEIMNSNAHSGWIWEAGSLANHEDEDMEDIGSLNGLNLAVNTNAKKWPEKIAPSPLPTGFHALIDIASTNIKATTHINDSMLGLGPQDRSGVAEQSRQYAAQQSLALPLDNLARSRHMLAERVLDYIQDFISDERVIHITQLDAFGRPQSQPVTVNQQMPDGSILHDLTLGKYGIVIAEQPMQITFDNSQFEQCKAIEELLAAQGKHIPVQYLLKYSNLADKAEIAQAIDTTEAPQPSPLEEADANLKTAQAQAASANAELTKAKAVQTLVTAEYGATQAAAQVAAVPHLAPVADTILESAGFPAPNPIPQDAGAGIPAPVPGELPVAVPQKTTMPHNTHPQFPASPDQGVDAGIEGGQ